MTGVASAFWRAAGYCLHPRVILLSLAPVLVAGGVVLGGAWLYWANAVDAVNEALSYWTLSEAVLGWLSSIGFDGVRSIVAPLIVVALAVPAVVMLSLLLVALLMTPSIVSLVARRRFPALERRRGASGWHATFWSLGVTAVAALLLVASVPLWLVPPLGLVLPPLVWGWAGGKIFAFEVLAEHADAEERQALLATHKASLTLMGVVTGFMGAVPTLVWAIGVVAIVFAPFLLLVSVWLYTLVFAFAAAWFAHFALAALQQLRAEQAASEVTAFEASPIDTPTDPRQPAALPPPTPPAALPGL
jgi:hypothetical protein